MSAEQLIKRQFNEQVATSHSRIHIPLGSPAVRLKGFFLPAFLAYEGAANDESRDRLGFEFARLENALRGYIFYASRSCKQITCNAFFRVTASQRKILRPRLTWKLSLFCLDISAHVAVTGDSASLKVFLLQI